MLGDRLRKYSLRSVRGLLALLFAVSGVGKLIDGQSAADLTQTILDGALGPMGAQVLVVAVSGTEVVLSGLLALGWWPRWIFGIAFGLVAGFTMGLTTLLGGAGVASCGCFGAFSLGLSLEATILRNLGVLALALVGFLLADID